MKPLLDLTEEDMQRMFSVNVFGVHHCYSAAARQFIKQGKLSPDKDHRPTPVYKIIGAASIVAFKPFPLLSHYSASKWAVRGLTQAYAMELAEHGITVNAYAPGIVGTAMWDLIDEKLAERSGAEKGTMIRKYVGDLTALGRVSTAEDVAGLVGFLASKDSDFVTGQTQVCAPFLEFDLVLHAPSLTEWKRLWMVGLFILDFQGLYDGLGWVGRGGHLERGCVWLCKCEVLWLSNPRCVF